MTDIFISILLRAIDDDICRLLGDHVDRQGNVVSRDLRKLKQPDQQLLSIRTVGYGKVW